MAKSEERARARRGGGVLPGGGRGALGTDLSHYLPDESARRLDALTCKAVEEGRAEDIGRGQACGRAALCGLLHLAKARGLALRTVDLRNSGDSGGPRDRVVGYGAWVLA